MDQNIDRRTVLKAAGALAAAAAGGTAQAHAQGCGSDTSCSKPKLEFNNADFYQDGKFLPEKGKDAIVALCKYHGYPVFPELRDKLWITDYGTGEFTKLGLAAYMFVNNVEDRYMLMDIYLLPGQMLPEHWHLAAEGNPAKLEGRVIRHGVSHVVGIGEPNLGKDVVVPKCHMGGKVTVEHETVATPGIFVKLSKVETRHWQLAGPEGVILSEVANVHTNSGVRHTDPVLNAFFLKG